MDDTRSVKSINYRTALSELWFQKHDLAGVQKRKFSIIKTEITCLIFHLGIFIT